MTRKSRLGRLIYELARPLNVCLLLFWITYLYIWTQGWADSELFDSQWRFDAIGHAAGGFFGALSFLYLFRRYSVKGIFNIAGGLFMSVSIIGIITISGVLWEAIELIWDWVLQPNYFEWLAKAQKNSADTTIDILFNTAFAAVAMLAATLFRVIYRRIYPDKSGKYEAEEILARIEHLSRDLRSQRTEHLRQIGRVAFPKIKELMRSMSRKAKKQEPGP
ncbi:MAG: hypothetical protein HYT22_02600 [Candidatus Niyogibacteria bacterium]|nr:hypothetical protein [Candidatus Niyogibacteria bacterium]